MPRTISLAWLEWSSTTLRPREEPSSRDSEQGELTPSPPPSSRLVRLIPLDADGLAFSP